MEDRLDQLFREKLTNHRLTPTENAWGRIHHELAAKRRKIWMNRMAIAASVLLFLSAGFIAFQYVKQLDTRSPIVMQHEDADKTEKLPLSGEQDAKEEKNPGILEFTEAVSVTDDALTKTKNNTLDSNKVQASPEMNNSSLLAKNEVVKNPVTKADNVVKEESDMSEPLIEGLSISHMEIHLAKNTGVEESIEREARLSTENDSNTDQSSEKVKDYPSITVTYKASQNSELLARKETGVLNKGIKKISRFSDEHIVTDEVKTKLRNTKEDLLALNFGKIINRSSKDLEN